MMYDTNSPAEWAEALSFAAGVYAALSVPYFLLVDAELSDFDPRPAARRAVESGRLDPLLVAVANSKHDAHAAGVRALHVPRDLAVSATALLMLLTVSPGGTR